MAATTTAPMTASCVIIPSQASSSWKLKKRASSEAQLPSKGLCRVARASNWQIIQVIHSSRLNLQRSNTYNGSTMGNATSLHTSRSRSANDRLDIQGVHLEQRVCRDHKESEQG
jgi:hypothetical protein